MPPAAGATPLHHLHPPAAGRERALVCGRALVGSQQTVVSSAVGGAVLIEQIEQNNAIKSNQQPVLISNCANRSNRCLGKDKPKETIPLIDLIMGKTVYCIVMHLRLIYYQQTATATIDAR